MRIWEIEPKKFGDDLREMRMDKQLTQKELANRMMNAGVASVINWEHGESLPNVAPLIELCKIFKIDEVRINTSERWYR